MPDRHYQLTIKLPEAKDEFQAAEDLLKLKPAIDGIREILCGLEFQFTLERKTDAPAPASKPPRATRSDKGTTRQPKIVPGQPASQSAHPNGGEREMV